MITTVPSYGIFNRCVDAKIPKNTKSQCVLTFFSTRKCVTESCRCRIGSVGKFASPAAATPPPLLHSALIRSAAAPRTVTEPPSDVRKLLYVPFGSLERKKKFRSACCSSGRLENTKEDTRN